MINISVIEFEGKEGKIKSLAFSFLRKTIIVSMSETKWRSGGIKKPFIWFSSVGGGIKCIFINKLAVGIDLRKGVK